MRYFLSSIDLIAFFWLSWICITDNSVNRLLIVIIIVAFLLLVSSVLLISCGRLKANYRKLCKYSLYAVAFFNLILAFSTVIVFIASWADLTQKLMLFLMIAIFIFNSMIMFKDARKQ